MDTFQFYNERSDVKKPMKLKDQEEMAYQAAASAGPIALGLTCYSSTNSAKKDPFVLSQVKGNESTLRLEYVSPNPHLHPNVGSLYGHLSYAVDRICRSIRPSTFETSRTTACTTSVRLPFSPLRTSALFFSFLAWVLGTGRQVMSLDGETGTNAVITVLIAKTEGDLTRPPPPPPGTNPGTNPDCDKPRPDCMDEYLKCVGQTPYYSSFRGTPYVRFLIDRGMVGTCCA